MVVVCGPSDILHYRPHRYANSSLDKPTHGSFLRHYGMDFAVTPCHNHAYSYKCSSNRDIAGISTHVDGYCFAIISDFCASIIESGTVIYHRLSKKGWDSFTGLSLFHIHHWSAIRRCSIHLSIRGSALQFTTQLLKCSCGICLWHQAISEQNTMITCRFQLTNFLSRTHTTFSQ